MKNIARTNVVIVALRSKRQALLSAIIMSVFVMAAASGAEASCARWIPATADEFARSSFGQLAIVKNDNYYILNKNGCTGLYEVNDNFDIVMNHVSQTVSHPGVLTAQVSLVRFKSTSEDTDRVRLYRNSSTLWIHDHSGLDYKSVHNAGIIDFSRDLNLSEEEFGKKYSSLDGRKWDDSFLLNGATVRTYMLRINYYLRSNLRELLAKNAVDVTVFNSVVGFTSRQITGGEMSGQPIGFSNDRPSPGFRVYSSGGDCAIIHVSGDQYDFDDIEGYYVVQFSWANSCEGLLN